MSKAPNLLFIITHDLGRHLGCYGNNSINTSNINNLAEDGVVFDNYFTTSPLCSPSRGSIVTGKYPHCHGLIGLAHLGWGLNDGEKTMAHYFKDAGYSTHLFGMQHETHNPVELGYDTVQHKRVLCQDVVPLVNDFLRHKAYNGDNNKPFFAMVGFEETHRPYPKELYEYDNPDEVEVPPYLPDNHLVREDIAQFHGSIRKMDRYVGEILDTLEELRLKDNTIIVFTTDHGIAFPRAKSTLYDTGIGTALIISWKKALQGGRKCSELLCSIDLLPTLLELAGIVTNNEIQGKSFASWLKNYEFTGREEIFAEKSWHDSYDPMRCIRTNKYKYIRNFLPGPLLVFPGDIAESLSRKTLGDHPISTARPEEELYDLAKDPDELCNLAGRPEYEEVRLQLKEKLRNWMEQTEDPLLKGHISIPGVNKM